MSDTTLIAWTDRTANFWMGCQKVSDGCKHCYAETLTKNRMGLSLWGPAATTARQRVKSVGANLSKWQREAEAGEPGARGPGKFLLVFVGSLMDWAEDHPQLDTIRADMWRMIRQSRHLEFQLLTKRADRIERLLPADWGAGYPNVWLGTSIEDMRVAKRADYLRAIPAAIRFVSYEPALGPLDDLDLTGIDWVIYGGESGPGFRGHDLDWPRMMLLKCAQSGSAFFYKQSSAIRTEMGTELDGKTVRQWPTPRVIAAPAASRHRSTAQALPLPWTAEAR